MVAAPAPIRRRPARLTLSDARRMALSAQRLIEPEPFGAGPAATAAAVAHLGYVQIDTISVIERCHHHILQTRIPAYRREDLAACQSADRTVFEAWTHALSYVHTGDYRHYVAAMRAHRDAPPAWYASVDPADVRRLLRRIRDEGPLTIRDIVDDEPVEKTHPWASRKPSKRALEHALFSGRLVVSARQGMVKTYELSERHFGWERTPAPASETATLNHRLDRALRSQGLVSLDSVCHLDAGAKPAIRALVEARLRRRTLKPVVVEGAEGVEHWASPEALETIPPDPPERILLLSPFDPLVIQRRRFALLFGHDHRFEAYVPAEKRVLGYFALPVLAGETVVGAIDLKADRRERRLEVRRWTDLAPQAADHRAAIEAALDRFARFQFPDD